MTSIAQINREYEAILKESINGRIKSIKLAALMIKMEREFNIPLIIDKEFQRQNKSIMSLYRKISNSRDL